MQGLVVVAAMLLGLVTLIAPLVGFVWVGALGEWGVFFAGLAAYFGGAFVISLLMSPGLLLAAASVASLEKGNVGTASVTGMLTLMWTLVAVAGWCYGVQYYFFDVASYRQYWPFGLLAFGGCMAPLARLAHADRDNPHSHLTMFSMGIATLVSILYSIVERDFSSQAFYVIYSIAAVVSLAFSAFLVAAERPQHR